MKRNRGLFCYVTDFERQDIEKAAAKAGLSVSAFLRVLALKELGK